MRHPLRKIAVILLFAALGLMVLMFALRLYAPIHDPFYGFKMGDKLLGAPSFERTEDRAVHPADGRHWRLALAFQAEFDSIIFVFQRIDPNFRNRSSMGGGTLSFSSLGAWAGYARDGGWSVDNPVRTRPPDVTTHRVWLSYRLVYLALALIAGGLIALPPIRSELSEWAVFLRLRKPRTAASAFEVIRT